MNVEIVDLSGQLISARYIWLMENKNEINKKKSSLKCRTVCCRRF